MLTRLLTSFSRITFLLFICLPASYAQQTVIWASTSAPDEPIYKEYTSIQLGFEIQRLVFAHLPEYQIQYRPQNGSRVFWELLNEPNVCTGTKIRTAKRDAQAVASRFPQVLIEGLRLMVREQDEVFDDMDINTPTDMLSFMQRYPKALLGYVIGRSYGDAIDQQLQYLNTSGKVYQRSAEHGSIGAIDMLLEGKVNVILDFLILTQDYLKQRQNPIGLRYVELAGADTYANGHIYCSNSQFGQRLMKKINKVMQNAVKERIYLDIHLSYIDPKRHVAFIDYYNKTFETSFRK
ncbi:hypothetical protein [uncultured Paraglaciecola sp.]|uniref:hypothetical protein n=1 Tax=uncultured Paraglaciecola sp. TaxID=1765024 RepID=UPI0025F74B3B|nr:hypothetical protein [uncultured Paraglaciecola sp.]